MFFFLCVCVTDPFSREEKQMLYNNKYNNASVP